MKIDPSMIYQKYQTEAQKAGKAPSVAKGMSSYKEGNVIKGEVVDSRATGISIRLESGEVLQARLTGPNTYSIGENVSFVVKESGGEQLLLASIVTEEKAGGDQLMNILQEAGVPKNEANLELLKALIDQQLPVDKDSLKQMVRLMAENPGASPKDVAFLTKHQVPVNEDNLMQLKMLEEDKQPLLKSIASLVDDISTILSKNTDDTNLQTQLDQILNGKGRFFSIQQPTEVANGKEPSPSIQSAESQEADGQNQGSTEKEPMPLNRPIDGKELILSNQQVNGKEPSLSIQSADAQKAEEQNQALADKEPSSLNQQVNGKEPSLSIQPADAQKAEEQNQALADKEPTLMNQQVNEKEPSLSIQDQLRSFVADVKEETIYQALAKELLLSDMKTIEEGQVNRWFNEVQEKVQHILEATSESAEGETVAKGAGEVKTSINFLNSLQQDYSFMHLPMFMDDQLMNAELYVMNRSKSKKDGEQAITALIRLDLRNLGHTDIYVKKTGKNLDVQFFMKEEGQLEVVRGQVFQLHKMLKSKGFNVLSATVQPLKEDFNPVDDFLEKKGKKSEINRYSFDMKA